jgi:hypothetical protein
MRDCLFVALTGHELGFLGINNYIKRRLQVLKHAHSWIHFGANLGAARQPIRIQTSDRHLEQLVVAALGNEGIVVDAKTDYLEVPRGEASVLQKGGVRYLAPICGSEVFHHASDRWPDAVDVAVLARYTTAFSNTAINIALQND